MGWDEISSNNDAKQWIKANDEVSDYMNTICEIWKSIDFDIKDKNVEKYTMKNGKKVDLKTALEKFYSSKEAAGIDKTFNYFMEYKLDEIKKVYKSAGMTTQFEKFRKYINSVTDLANAMQSVDPNGDYQDFYVHVEELKTTALDNKNAFEESMPE